MQPPQKSPATTRINTLQYGRALAALAVVLLHSTQQVAYAIHKPPAFVEAIASKGNLGVDFFFVLSGFIIMHAHANDPRGGVAALSYAKKRLKRIYIPYLPVSLAMMFVYATLPEFSTKQIDWGVWTSVTLLPDNRSPALAVAWTLRHEMLFYALFLLSYFTPRFAGLLAAWVLAIFAAMAMAWKADAPALRILLAPINLEFVAGMIAACAYAKLSTRWWPALLGIGVAGIAIAFAALGHDAGRLWIGLSMAPIVLATALLEKQKELPPVAWALLLGNASYAIYLVHYPISSVVVRLSRHAHISWQLSLMLCIGGAVAIGIAYHLLIEKPGIKMVSRWGGVSA
jgi:exopolysaccharide production protein ExoZ